MLGEANSTEREKNNTEQEFIIVIARNEAI